MSAKDRHRRDAGPLDRERATDLVEHVCLDPSGTAARTLVVAAHPSDETIGASYLLAQLPEVQVLHLSDGAPKAPAAGPRGGCAAGSEYGALRRAELLAAMAVAGIAPEQCGRLGLPDGYLWCDLDTSVWGVVEAFMTVAPDLILTHAYEGGDPDHDATAFAVHSAVRVLARMRLPVPAVAEFTSYHRAGDGGLATGAFLDPDAETVVAVELGGEDRQRKHLMFRAFASQAGVLEAFDIGSESYRAAPRHDFTRPPHAGRLFYETQPGNVTGARWRASAVAATERLRTAVAGVAAWPHASRPRSAAPPGRGVPRAC